MATATVPLFAPVGDLADLPVLLAGQFAFTLDTHQWFVGDGSTNWEIGAGGGDVNGPGSSVDNEIVRFDGTGGTDIQGSGVTISDAGEIALTDGYYLGVDSTFGTFRLWDESLTPMELLARGGNWRFNSPINAAAGIQGDGSGLTGLNASSLASGTVPNARLDADLQTLAGNDGSGLTSLNASNLSSGSIPAARIAADTITLAMMANADPVSILMNATGSSVNPVWGTLGGPLSFSGNTLTISDGAIATAKLADDAITYAKLQNASATQRILARRTVGSGDYEESTLSQILDFSGASDGAILYRNGGSWTYLAIGGSAGMLLRRSTGSIPEWATPSSYALHVGSLSFAPADLTTYYAGPSTIAAGTTAATRKVYIPRAGIIKAAEIIMRADTVAGSNENISMNIRLNNSTDTLIQTVGAAAAERRFTNTSLSITVAAGDYIELKMLSPSWGTNPTGVTLGGHIYVE